MPSTDPRQAACHFRVSRADQQQHQPHQTIKPTDFFDFDITAILRSPSTDSNSHPRRISPLLQTSIFTSCKNFFQDGQDVLRTRLTHPYFSPDSLGQITHKVISQVQQMFDQSLASSDPDPDPGFTKPSDSEYQVFPLALDIIVDLPYDDELAVMEESMQEDRMVPASKEAIQSLTKFKLTKQCNICMEDFDVGGDDDGAVEVSPMPCGHVFHQQCIVRWLQTSQMCPLCRYPMPTARN